VVEEERRKQLARERAEKAERERIKQQLALDRLEVSKEEHHASVCMGTITLLSCVVRRTQHDSATCSATANHCGLLAFGMTGSVAHKQYAAKPAADPGMHRLTDTLGHHDHGQPHLA
jgi:hypothetical protein